MGYKNIYLSNLVNKRPFSHRWYSVTLCKEQARFLVIYLLFVFNYKFSCVLQEYRKNRKCFFTLNFISSFENTVHDPVVILFYL